MNSLFLLIQANCFAASRQRVRNVQGYSLYDISNNNGGNLGLRRENAKPFVLTLGNTLSLGWSLRALGSHEIRGYPRLCSVAVA